ncbi:AraC family transcriptional regulator [Pedobacter cryoconitis]|uniref:AraC family transcriptional regulator n=1 Tax=Pedobacter cryoconitis TaxID=188932 RepID=A0A127VDG5_9SPHI|nr:AraC family transcriptional regulator [Pedobacter cryoconitis]AMP99344.1 AraC family transcriptional regulator [Pedobacter cryoconitis]
MKFHHLEPVTKGEFHLTINEADFDRSFFQRDRTDKFLTIAWNRGAEQVITIDGVKYDFPEQSILPLMVNQSFQFEKPGQVIAWQYNRNFYCIVDHDKEVSCVGFLFYGSTGNLFVRLNEQEQKKITLLFEIFIEEFNTIDNIQREMLQMLLKRLIIIITRLAKSQYITDKKLTDDKLDIIRRYNLLVEQHFRLQHQVQFYAELLNRSPKTLANLFAIYNHKSPLAVIQERVVLEAKRLLIYTDKSAKEIAYELGFDDAAYFSNFFKKQVSFSPSDFRAARLSS